MAFMIFSSFPVCLFFKKKLVIWLLKSIGVYVALKEGLGTCVTHKLPGFAVGWEFLLFQNSVSWASIEWCWRASVAASGPARSPGMRKWSTCPRLTVYSEALESKQQGEKESQSIRNTILGVLY